MRPLAAKLLLRLDSSAKSGGVLLNMFCLGAGQPCFLVVAIPVCHTSMWLATVDGRNSAPPKTELLLAPSLSPI